VSNKLINPTRIISCEIVGNVFLVTVKVEHTTTTNGLQERQNNVSILLSRVFGVTKYGIFPKSREVSVRFAVASNPTFNTMIQIIPMDTMRKGMRGPRVILKRMDVKKAKTMKISAAVTKIETRIS